MREDVRIARLMARSVIVFAGLLVPLVSLLWIATPGFPGEPMFPPRILGLSYDVACHLVGLGGMIIGLGWMIRIYRADPEPCARTWRYRDF